MPYTEKRRTNLWSYLLVGLVGAIIGGFLVVGIAPQVLIHRAGALRPILTGVVSTGEQNSPAPTQVFVPVGDPFDSIILAANRVRPAVVGIVNKTVGYDFFGRQFQRETSGSGLIIAPDGYIVTNCHVVEGSKGLLVSLPDGRTLDATLVGKDASTDLAVVKVDATGLPVGVFGDSDDLRLGQLAVAIGNPLGLEFERTVTHGCVSGLDRVLIVGDFYLRLIQTDAAINPGNSGGPLVNAQGEVIGLNSAKISADVVEGMGFAIPSNQVRRIAQEIIEKGSVKRAFAGLQLVDKRIAAAQGFDFQIDRGLYVYSVVKGGPAYGAGVAKGDFVLEFNGTPVNQVGTFQALLLEKAPGEQIQLKVLRGGKEMTFTVSLTEAPD